jgi:hypothetical protein
VSSCCYICVLILLYMCPHTATYVSSCCYMCVLMLLYMCSHTAMYVSSDAARELYNNAKELYMEGIGVEADCVEAIFNLGLCCRHMARLEYMHGKKKISSLPALFGTKVHVIVALATLAPH